MISGFLRPVGTHYHGFEYTHSLSNIRKYGETSTKYYFCKHQDRGFHFVENVGKGGHR